MQLGVLGERCKVPHWGLGRSPAEIEALHACMICRYTITD